jgi:hypothetical protein
VKLVIDVTLRHPLDVVFATYRDELPSLVAYLPNLQAIHVVEREELADGSLRLVNEWVGGGEIPSFARGFLNESMLRWTDHAKWDPRAHTTDWRTDVHAFPDAIRSSGVTRYVAAGDTTRLEMRGDLVSDASKVPGVPRLLAATINGAVERYFIAKVEENTRAIAAGVEKYLSEKASS